MSTATAPKVKGYVYFFHSPETGRTKIGKARWPRDRLAAIRSHVPDAEMIVAIGSDDPLWLERFLHMAFAHRRVHGEWFQLDGSDINLVRQLPERVFSSDDLLPELRVLCVTKHLGRAAFPALWLYEIGADFGPLLQSALANLPPARQAFVRSMLPPPDEK